MIFHWLRQFLLKIKWLFAPAKPEDIALIDPNAPCPVCGAHDGELRTVLRTTGAGGNQPVLTPFCQHRCKVCGARWREKPVVKVDITHVDEAIARNELESKEDAWLWSHRQIPEKREKTN